MFASYETQLRLFVHLIQLCQQDPHKMREFIPVRELFDALSIIYPNHDFSDEIGAGGVAGVGGGGGGGGSSE